MGWVAYLYLSRLTRPTEQFLSVLQIFVYNKPSYVKQISVQDASKNVFHSNLLSILSAECVVCSGGVVLCMIN